MHCIKDDPTEPLTDGQAVSNAIDTLSITYAEGESSTNVTTNIVLTAMADHGVMVSWSSSNTNVIAVIATNGEVTRPDRGDPDTQVVLIATLFRGMITNTKSFTLTVLAIPPTDRDAVEIASNELQIDLRGQPANGIITNIGLPQLGAHGVMVSWESSAASFITTNGMVTRPALGQPNEQVTLTATLYKGEVTNTKTFSLTVLALPTSDTDAVEQARSALQIDLRGQDDQ